MRLFVPLLVALALSPAALAKCPKGTKTQKAKHPNGAIKSLGCALPDGTHHGPWQEWYPEGGQRAVGEYDNGMRTKHWDSFFASGQPEESCDYRRDKRNGDCTVWYPSGQKRESSEWSDGRRNGKWSSWYEDGQPHEVGAYTADFTGAGGNFKQGDWVVYHPNGQKMLEAHYEYNQPDGAYLEYYPSGTMRSEGVMRGGKLEGAAVHYHPNGVKAMIANYMLGELSGTVRSYAPNGRKIEEAEYKEGQRSGTSTVWTESGELLAHQCFQWGARVAVTDASAKPPKCPPTTPLSYPPAINAGHDFSDGYAAVRMGLKWGFIDARGALTVPPKFSKAGDFVSGLARVSTDGKTWYAIDKTGDRVTRPAPAAGAKGSSGGISRVTAEHQIDYKKDGRSLWASAQLQPAPTPSLFQVQKGGKWGFIDAKGAEVIAPRFDAAGPFSEGLAAAASQGRLGYIDAKGAWAISPRFTTARPFHCGMAVVTDQGDLTYVDSRGIRLTQAELAQADDCEGGLARIKITDNFGFLHPVGRMVIAARLDDIEAFHDGLAKSRKGAAFIDRTGQKLFAGNLPLTGFAEGSAVVLAKVDGKQRYGVLALDGSFKPFALAITAADDPEFSPFSSGFTAAMLKKGTGYLGRDGKTLVEPSYKHGRSFSEGLAAVQTDKGWGFIGTDGKEAIAPAFSAVGDFHGGVARAGKDGKWGYIAKDGKWLLQPTYDEAHDFDRGLGQVISGDTMGWIDASGTIVWKPSK